MLASLLQRQKINSSIVLAALNMAWPVWFLPKKLQNQGCWAIWSCIFIACFIYWIFNESKEVKTKEDMENLRLVMEFHITEEAAEELVSS